MTARGRLAGSLLPAKKYLALFRVRFQNEMQYRVAALAGVCTQFVWGFMEILLFRAFYAGGSEMPMTFSQLVTYEWLQQAFLALFMLWFWDKDIIEAITGGNIAYELARPMDLYNMWFTRVAAQRIARALLRCLPVLLVAFLLPEPYRMSLPVSFGAFLLFVVSTALGLCVVAALTMLVYALTFFTMSASGVRIFAASIAELLSGAVVPLPFFPEKWRLLAELSPFAAVQNLPLRLYFILACRCSGWWRWCCSEEFYCAACAAGLWYREGEAQRLALRQE